MVLLFFGSLENNKSWKELKELKELKSVECQNEKWLKNGWKTVEKWLKNCLITMMLQNEQVRGHELELALELIVELELELEWELER